MSNFIKTTVEQKKSLTHDVIELVLRPETELQSKPGQFVNLVVPEDRIQTRAYSLANHPGDEGIIRLLIKILDGGVAGEYLKDVRKGDEVQILRPAGTFTYRSAGAKRVHMVCTGTGIAPLLSMLEHELAAGSKTEFRLYIGLRFKVDIFWEDYLDDLQKKYPNFSYQITLSRPVDYWEGRKGYVNELVSDADWQHDHFYLCGVPNMIDDMRERLKEKGVPDDHVFFEKYTSPGLTAAGK